MIPMTQLLLPIAASAVAVFLVSAILHMVLQYHRADYRRIPNQDEAIAGIAKANLAPGLYHFPYFESMKECNTPEAIERFKRGPNGSLTIMPNGSMGMGRALGLWFFYCLLVSVAVGCLAGSVLAVGAIAKAVFHFAAGAAFLAYCLSCFVDSVWKAAPWGNTIRAMIDGLIYALVTGGVFAWLWPG